MRAAGTPRHGTIAAKSMVVVFRVRVLVVFAAAVLGCSGAPSFSDATGLSGGGLCATTIYYTESPRSPSNAMRIDLPPHSGVLARPLGGSCSDWQSTCLVLERGQSVEVGGKLGDDLSEAEPALLSEWSAPEGPPPCAVPFDEAWLTSPEQDRTR